MGGILLSFAFEEWQQYNGATVELAAAAADGRTAAA